MPNDHDIPLGPSVKLTIERRGQIVLLGLRDQPAEHSESYRPETSESLGRAFYDYKSFSKAVSASIMTAPPQML
jgi:hypothetical protein